MSPDKITVGKTYCNRGKGRTRRTVLEICDTLCADSYGCVRYLGEPVVRYRQGDREGKLYLSTFAAWCGKEVCDDRSLVAEPVSKSKECCDRRCEQMARTLRIIRTWARMDHVSKEPRAKAMAEIDRMCDEALGETLR